MLLFFCLGYFLTPVFFSSLTVVVTINISVKPRQSPATPPKVKKPVSLLPGELVCSEVPRRPRTRRDLVVCTVSRSGGVEVQVCFVRRFVDNYSLFPNKQSNFMPKLNAFLCSKIHGYPFLCSTIPLSTIRSQNRSSTCARLKWHPHHVHECT
jgi:hypothetical protein